jgi:hypothetical protein
VTSSVIAHVGLQGGVLYIIGTDGKDVVHVNTACDNRLIIHANFEVGHRGRGGCNEDLGATIGAMMKPIATRIAATSGIASTPPV